MLKKIIASWWATFNAHPQLMVGAFFVGMVIGCLILIAMGEIP